MTVTLGDGARIMESVASIINGPNGKLFICAGSAVVVTLGVAAIAANAQCGQKSSIKLGPIGVGTQEELIQCQ